MVVPGRVGTLYHKIEVRHMFMDRELRLTNI